MPPNTQFHILSFEGPDPYARAGGIASRVSGLASALAAAGFETHLWFIGDPDRRGHEQIGERLTVHRWCQWISRHHPGGVYEGEPEKVRDYGASLPPFLFREVLEGQLVAGGDAVILAEEWQTAQAVTRLDALLRHEHARDRVQLLWNANNTFGFERIDWAALRAASTITTVSRYMKHLMWTVGVDPVVIPNGLGPDAFQRPGGREMVQIRQRFRERTVLAKVARFDPDKRWLLAIETLAALKRRGRRPLLIARGGMEAHGADVLAAAEQRGIRTVRRRLDRPGAEGLFAALASVEGADLVIVDSPLDAEARFTLFRTSDAVLANSGREPFGLVGLETMAAGGLACTGCTGEDYAEPGRNALVLQTSDPAEFIQLYERMRSRPSAQRALRRRALATARAYAWSEVLERHLLPRVDAA